MKNLLIATVAFFATLQSFAQADSIARPMNGFYKWNGEQFYADTLWADTSMFDASTGNIYLSLDTLGSAASGYYKIIVSAGGGQVKGGGTAPQVPFFIGTDSLSSSTNVTYDSTNTRLLARDFGGTLDTDLGIFLGTEQRINFNTNNTSINTSDAASDFLIFSNSDTALSVNVDSSRVGINVENLVTSKAALTIRPNNSDDILNIVAVQPQSGGESVTIGNAPVASLSSRYIPIKLTDPSGVVAQAYIIVLIEP